MMGGRGAGSWRAGHHGHRGWHGARAARLGAALVVLAPASLAGQLQPREAAGWPAVEIGARAGYDNIQRAQVLGALLRIPVLPGGNVELLPSADVTFQTRLKEYQLNAEGVYLLASEDGGLYAGGGIGLRNTIPGSDLAGGRRTFTTWSIVVGLKLTSFERVNPLIEFRRIFARELVVDPQLLSLGASFELW